MYSLNLGWIHSYSIFANNMSQKFHFPLEEVALLWRELQSSRLQPFKYLLEIVQLLLKVSSRNQGGIQIDETNREGQPANTCSIKRSKMAGALHKPKGITRNCHRPLPAEKAVFPFDSSSISTCQYPLIRSSEENHLAPARASNVSSMRIYSQHRILHHYFSF